MSDGDSENLHLPNAFMAAFSAAAGPLLRLLSICKTDRIHSHRCQRLFSLLARPLGLFGRHCHYQIVSETLTNLLPVTMPSVLPKRPYQEVEFKAIDGLTLRGSLYPAASKGPAVIMTPGVSTTRLVTLVVVSHVP